MSRNRWRLTGSCSVWYPTIQFTCKIFNPNTKERTWKSVNVSNFVTPPARARQAVEQGGRVLHHVQAEAGLGHA